MRRLQEDVRYWGNRCFDSAPTEVLNLRSSSFISVSAFVRSHEYDLGTVLVCVLWLLVATIAMTEEKVTVRVFGFGIYRCVI